MKKSTIWLLTIVMTITIGALLYFQLMYLEKMVKMRNEQFNESVSRSLSATANLLEREETLHFLSEDIDAIESSLYGFDSSIVDDKSNVVDSASWKITMTQANPLGVADIGSRYQNMHEALRRQYLYQRGLLNELILTILRESGQRPAIERADSTIIRKFLTQELANNGLKVPFVFAVETADNNVIYETAGFDNLDKSELYTQELFQNSDTRYKLVLGFPTKSDYVFSSVKFIIPSLAFTLILIFVFLYTIIMAFRQKKLSEIKSDFINNMTHELKTPISTISLAAQMLNDDSVLKSPGTLKHLSSVITDEAKRLRFNVDKVLQLSVFDDADSQTALKFSEVDVNKVISNVMSTFKIKAEKFNGDITVHLDARNPMVYVDEMQFTNVIFNLLDNALKYKKEDVEPHLVITTCDLPENKVEIRVTDNGIGISREDIKRIFEKFYRVSTGNRHDVKGFGIGLAYVKKMVQLFNGTITVESELGKGTTFVIQLPVN